MASLDSSMPPSTHCSAAMSCGGVRSKSPPLGAISVTLTCPPPPSAAGTLSQVPASLRLYGRPDYFIAAASDISFASGPGGSARPHQGRPIRPRLGQSCGPRPHGPTQGVQAPVDSLCRHAVRVVRSLGALLGTVMVTPCSRAIYLLLCDPPVVWKKKLGGFFSSTTGRSYPHTKDHRVRSYERQAIRGIRPALSDRAAIVRVCVRPLRPRLTSSPVRSMISPRTAVMGPSTPISPSASPGCGGCWPTSIPSWPGAAPATRTPGSTGNQDREGPGPVGPGSFTIRD